MVLCSFSFFVVTSPSTYVPLVNFFLHFSLCTQDKTVGHQNYRTAYLKNNMARYFLFFSNFQDFSQNKKKKLEYLPVQTCGHPVKFLYFSS